MKHYLFCFKKQLFLEAL